MEYRHGRDAALLAPEAAVQSEASPCLGMLGGRVRRPVRPAAGLCRTECLNPFRVYLREHTMADCRPYCEWQTDPEVMKFADKPVQSKEEALAGLVESVAQQADGERRKYFMAVVLKGSDEMIGDVGITRNERGFGDMGWFLRRAYWGKGYATEAVLLLIQYAAERLNLKKIFASCHRANKASERIMIKCGFTLFTSNEGRLYYMLDKNTRPAFQA
ncbi:MAG: hypothetical protein A2X46_14750 [Lentisphaerae bacterium GWF2_57_35]|nr:MAG: hypothetical protein A2X46_14750 [Lentisphaerae bacterium GWF2_57_35]